jgi:glucokinase
MGRALRTVRDEDVGTEVEPQGDWALGVDVGGTRTKFASLRSDGTEGPAVTEETVTSSLPALLESVSRAARRLAGRLPGAWGNIRGVGVGVPGHVAGCEVSLVWPELSFLEGDRLQGQLEQVLEKPVVLENDARVVALGEAVLGRHPKSARMLSITLGTGIGVAFLIDRRFQEPTSITHMAGHLPSPRRSQRCFCGLPSCQEPVLSGRRVMRDAARLKLGDVRDLFGTTPTEPRHTQAVNDYLTDLATSLNSYVNIYAPDLIVLGGGVGAHLGQYVAQLRRAVVAAPAKDFCLDIRVSQLGERAGSLGAASLFTPAGRTAPNDSYRRHK